MGVLSIGDFILTPLYLIIVFLFARSTVSRKIDNEPYYKYFIPGLFVKIFGGIGVCLIYLFYYGGGDTVSYFTDGRTLVDLLMYNPKAFIGALQLRTLTYLQWTNLDPTFGYPIVYGHDHHAWYVIRCTWPFILLSFKSFIPATILLNAITFIPVWWLYKVFISEFPRLQKEFAIAVFFIPSVAFWGSGLLKDNITFAAVCLYTHGLHSMFVKREKYLVHLTQMFISYLLLTAIKPYIFFALLPGSLLWLSGILLSGFENKLIRTVTGPILVAVAAGTGYFALSLMGNNLGDFNLDTVFEKAVATQQDLKQDYYGGSSFDIGEFDATAGSMLSKAHLAIIAALFRPFLWETRNPVMLISALENFTLMMFSIYLLIKLRVIYLFRLLLRHHMLLFSFVFSIFFSFGVGLSTSNFGSLVRYKIPAMPFFVASLIIAREILYKTKAQIEADKESGFDSMVPEMIR